ncbi:MAG TPA: FAD-linked oxidase C-terminal domain-containing protein [Tepidisphaeraceae bacterium]|nr:FAD-linked oxidase C-terminal domain-containing protein [Tepidisphaeraceae bacterium]
MEKLSGDLGRVLKGSYKLDGHHRLLYATDASLYQVLPIGVVFPEDAEDVRGVLSYCNANRIGVLPRGGGTSLAGQCTNKALVMDLSPKMRRVLSVDGDRCVVEPGITVEELNRHLMKTGMLFAPDPATVAQASIGGCIGNNAAGARSIRYGRTSENVAGVEVVLTSGHRFWLEPGAGRRDPAAGNLARSVMGICAKYAELIRERFPKTIRRNAGYGLDLVLAQMDRGVSAEDLDLSGLICGSEGTLAAVVAAKLKLHPVPKYKSLAIASFRNLEECLDAVNPILTTNPSAVELLDDVVLEAAAGNTQCREYLKWLPEVEGKSPAAVLYIEYTSAVSQAEVEESFGKLMERVPGVRVVNYTDGKAMGDLWALRKAGEPLLHGLSGHRKPHTFVEDNAVPVENLPRFVAEFKKIVARHGTKAAYYAHASVGVLHVRPLIDLHDEKDLVAMRGIAVEVADLARECGGVMSGEHGDGRVRGPLLERFYGKELMGAFRELKNLFDPAGVLNPGNIVTPGAVETITQNLRINAIEEKADLSKIETYYSYEDQEGFRGALEACNGAGVCRKTAVGTMCPSYRATLDERHATRGRGNALRTALTGQVSESGEPVWDDAGTMETLDLCLSCKACKSECPTNVDVARLKAEYTAQRYARKGVPLAARVFGNVRTLNRMGAMMPGVANWVNRLSVVRSVVGRVLGVAKERSIPAFSRSLYKRVGPRAKALGLAVSPRVVLFGDCFVTYNESDIGVAAVKVLEGCGYEVVVPRSGCCGRAMMSTGLLADAIRTAEGTIAQLREYIEDPNVAAVVVAEPSCLSAFKDDWLQLKMGTPMELRKKLAGKAYLIEEFVEKFWEGHPKRPVFKKADGAVMLHGHCHQKALWGDGTSAGLLKRVAGGENVTVIPSGCCGMAGAFGYTQGHYEVSMKIGELSLFGPIRGNKEAEICAPGTSCRHQIHDGTGRKSVHPIEWVAGRME